MKKSEFDNVIKKKIWCPANQAQLCRTTRVYTQKQAAEIFHVTPRTIHNRVRNGKLRTTAKGRIRLSDLEVRVQYMRAMQGYGKRALNKLPPRSGSGRRGGSKLAEVSHKELRLRRSLIRLYFLLDPTFEGRSAWENIDWNAAPDEILTPPRTAFSEMFEPACGLYLRLAKKFPDTGLAALFGLGYDRDDRDATKKLSTREKYVVTGLTKLQKSLEELSPANLETLEDVVLVWLQYNATGAVALLTRECVAGKLNCSLSTWDRLAQKLKRIKVLEKLLAPLLYQGVDGSAVRSEQARHETAQEQEKDDD